MSDPQAGPWCWPPTKHSSQMLCRQMASPSAHYTSLSKSGKLNSGSYCSLPSEILSRAYVIACINGLKVFNGNDTLGDSCGVAQASVDQSPGVLNGHRPFVLFKDGTQTEARGTSCLTPLPSTRPILEYKAHAH